MVDWDPQLYCRYEAERTRPAQELIARVSLLRADFISDLGCGPGNSTELLCNAWPQATVTGIDSSPAMLEQAGLRLPHCHFSLANINHWHPTEPQNLIYANASLQWVDAHDKLLPELVGQLATAGVLAIQMPDNFDQPSHRLMREVASKRPWRSLIPSATDLRKCLLMPERYYDLLTACGCFVDIWRTTYYHIMSSHLAIVDWLKATGLRPFLAALDSEQQVRFLADYSDQLSVAYPPRDDGSCLLAFPRLFMIAYLR